MATRQFSLQCALRMIPNRLLQEMFADFGHLDFDPGWSRLKEREIGPLLEYLETLPRDQLNEIESGLRSVAELACDTGINALVEACILSDQRGLIACLPAEYSVWSRAMFMWLRYRSIFEKAQMIHQVDHMSWWRKRNDLPGTAPDKSPAAIANLEREIAALLKTQGRGPDCTVEILARGDIDYFCAFPDDFVQNVLIHNEEHQLSLATLRRTMQIVFAYDRREGSLETYARLPKAIKEQLEVLFARVILHWDLDTYDPAAAYELDHLKDPWFKLTTDPADRLKIRIRKMRLSSRFSGRRLLIEVDDEDPEDNIHRAIDECIDLEAVPLSQWHVTFVTFCVEFLPLGARKPGRQSFDVGCPRSCTLRNARPERVELIQKYLKRWKIDLANSTVPALVAVGG